VASVQPARLKLALLDPQLRREVGVVATSLLDEALRVLTQAEDLEGVHRRTLGRESGGYLGAVLPRGCERRMQAGRLALSPGKRDR